MNSVITTMPGAPAPPPVFSIMNDHLGLKAPLTSWPAQAQTARTWVACGPFGPGYGSARCSTRAGSRRDFPRSLKRAPATSFSATVQMTRTHKTTTTRHRNRSGTRFIPPAAAIRDERVGSHNSGLPQLVRRPLGGPAGPVYAACHPESTARRRARPEPKEVSQWQQETKRGSVPDCS